MTSRQLFWRVFRQDRFALGALVFIAFLIFVAIFAPLIVKALGLPAPNKIDSTTLDSFGTPTGPSTSHPFGVDPLGRDLFARTLYGARVSLGVAIVSTGIATLIGVVLGLISGFYRGWVDSGISRLTDIVLAFPVLLLSLGLAAACSLGDGCQVSNPLQVAGLVLIGAGAIGAGVALGRGRRDSLGAPGVVAGIGVLVVIMATVFNLTIEPGAPVVIFVIALVSWTYISRIVRGQVLSLREKEFVEASRSLGASNTRIVFSEILPNLIVPVIVYATLILPTNILLEASLSFLGAGVQPPTPSWGAMIAEATGSFDSAWWYMLFPGLALLFTVLAFNLVGDGLSDALNPRQD
ncbi:MAG: ABC transporter permease [Acidobacteria bacterium]|nr:ABC transporter permease [Acidobacteriota bacterium]